ncbi:MAG: YigZ family protein [Clostridia bacterium]|nr:YigZ family protein [Clostridia bacterium]
MKEYLTVKGNASAETVIKHSRFIASIARVSGREEAAAFLEKINKRYSDATHNCYAYIADADNREVKFSDNGEPSGTAGQPILEVLKKNGLSEVCLVVTRYFGGIKLGASGLVGAYSSSAAAVLNEIEIIRRVPANSIELKCGYGVAGRVEGAVYSSGGMIKEKIYGEGVEFRCVFPKSVSFDGVFADITSGKGVLSLVGEEYIEEIVNE